MQCLIADLQVFELLLPSSLLHTCFHSSSPQSTPPPLQALLRLISLQISPRRLLPDFICQPVCRHHKHHGGQSRSLMLVQPPVTPHASVPLLSLYRMRSAQRRSTKNTQLKNITHNTLLPFMSVDKGLQYNRKDSKFYRLPFGVINLWFSEMMAQDVPRWLLYCVILIL